MKKNKVIIPIVILATTLVLSGCEIGGHSNGGVHDNTTDSFDLDNGEDVEEHDSVTKGSYTITLYANGDQHGVIEAGSGYVSYPTYITYIKEQMAGHDNSILISNGDLWQGTYESNIYYGEVLTELLDVAGYSCMTLGNHDFDWGQDVIRENKEKTNVPFLGCNIVYYGTDTLVDYVEPYTIVDTDCGLRVGIIGAINPDQWSSISSSYVQDIDFIDPLEPMQKYSDYMRSTLGCEIIVASFHAGTDDARSYISALGEESPNTGLPYIDAAFTSHDHTPNNGKINGVPYINSGDKNSYLSRITLNWSNGKVTSSETRNLNTASLSKNSYPEDEEARELIDNKITTEDKNKGNEVEGKLATSFYRYCSSGNYGPRLAARSMYEYCTSEGYNNLTCVFVNDTRAVLSAGNVTYANILEAVPFFDKTVIMKVKGSVLSRELRYAYGSGNSSASVLYYAPSETKINSNTTYTIAAYDYLAYHMNASTRQYNYFTEFEVVAELDMWPVDYISSYMNSFNGAAIDIDVFPEENYTCLS
ncbi:MAG: 5'-nucleotidase C-terminal domain-containing protein [Coprobacillus sp.]|nr:5'-nucleotidase C-terminal domain-containing protein [Coprobacillus sp.]